MRIPTTPRSFKAALHGRAGRVRALRGPLLARFTEDLQRLNDVLGTSRLDGRYWVFGGLLLGWAREGAILRHDSRDADFAIRREDLPRLYESVAALNRGGFRCCFRFSNSEGDVTELTFTRRGAQFEFFCMDSHDDTLRYFMYGFGPTGPVEVEAEEPEQALVPFELAGRTWLKPADHELQLSATYGDWRTPDQSWSYLRQPNIVRSRPWRATEHDW